MCLRFGIATVPSSALIAWVTRLVYWQAIELFKLRPPHGEKKKTLFFMIGPLISLTLLDLGAPAVSA